MKAFINFRVGNMIGVPHKSYEDARVACGNDNDVVTAEFEVIATYDYEGKRYKYTGIFEKRVEKE